MRRGIRGCLPTPKNDTPTGEKLEGSDAHTEEAEKTDLGRWPDKAPLQLPPQRDPEVSAGQTCNCQHNPRKSTKHFSSLSYCIYLYSVT